MGGTVRRRRGRAFVRTCACALCGLLLSPLHAGAYLETVESIEWLVADSDLVVRGRLVELADDAGDDWTGWRRAVIEVAETIKGTSAPDSRVTFRFWGSEREALLRGWQSAGSGERLVFLVASGRANDGHGGFDRYPFALRPGEWSIPSPDARRGAAFFTTDLRVLRGLEAAYANARRAAREKPAPARPLPFTNATDDVRPLRPAPYRAVYLPVPSDSDLRAELWRGDGVYLTVPFDERLGHAAPAWARDPRRRELGLSVLRHFKCDAHLRLLKDLLRDRGHVVSGEGKAATWHYPVREAARDVLREWGEDEPVSVAEPQGAYRPVGRAVGVAAASGLVIALVVTLLPIPLASRATRKRLSPGRRLRALVVVVASSLAVALLALGRRSAEHIDEVVFRAGADACWISSYRGGVQFVSVRGWPWQRDGGYACFDLAASPPSPWTDGGVATTNAWRWRGFGGVTGTVSPTAGTAIPYRRWTVPFAALAAAAGVLPLCAVLRPLSRRLRHRLWRRQHRCVACGYDLRGTAGAGRCPECGRSEPHVNHSASGVQVA